MERILSLEEQIRKFYFEKHLDFLTSVPQRRTQEIILANGLPFEASIRACRLSLCLL